MFFSASSAAPVAKGHTAEPFFQSLGALRFFSLLVVFLFHTRLYDYEALHTDNPLLLMPVRVLCSGNRVLLFS